MLAKISDGIYQVVYSVYCRCIPVNLEIKQLSVFKYPVTLSPEDLDAELCITISFSAAFDAPLCLIGSHAYNSRD